MQSFGNSHLGPYPYQGFSEVQSQGFTDQSFFDPASLSEEYSRTYANASEMPLEHLEDCPLARIEQYIANWMAEESLTLSCQVNSNSIGPKEVACTDG